MRTESLRPFTVAAVPAQRFLWPQSFDRVHAEQWARRDRAFLVMINSNKLPRLYFQELYTKRLAAVEYFHRFGEVDLYGPNWQQAPWRVGRTWVPGVVRRRYRQSGLEGVVWRLRQRIAPDALYVAAAAAHRGVAASKPDTLSRYTFALCFENMVLPGWMTEKLFDCLCAGTVPVYWGAPDVTDWVPSDCFVDVRRFANFAELRAFLHALSPGEIACYREAGRAFVESERFTPFRMATFSSMIERIVAEDAAALP